MSTNNYGIVLNQAGYLVTGNEIAYNKNAGILIQNSNNRIDGNHVAALSGSYGIELSTPSFYANNVIVRNDVFGAGSASLNYNIGGTANDVGPIGTAATSTSPWANISH